MKITDKKLRIVFFTVIFILFLLLISNVGAVTCSETEAFANSCSINLSCKSNVPKILLGYSFPYRTGTEWAFWSGGKIFDLNSTYVSGAYGDASNYQNVVIEWSSDVPRNDNKGKSVVPLNDHTYAWGVAWPNQNDIPVLSGVFTTPDCKESCGVSPPDNCIDGTGDSKVCITFDGGEDFKATITWTASGGNGFVDYVQVFDSGGTRVSESTNQCFTGPASFTANLPISGTYTYKIWHADCGRPDACTGCGSDTVVMSGGPFSCPSTNTSQDPGCYDVNGIFYEAGLLTPDNFGYYWKSATDIQTEPDGSNEACGCIKSTIWSNSSSLCCGDDTFDCGAIMGSSICNILDGTSSMISPDAFEGDIKYINCSGFEYLSDGSKWDPCSSTSSNEAFFLKKTVLSHDYLCYKIGRESIAECCGGGTCNSKTDGIRLQDGQIIVLNISEDANVSSGKNPLLTITPNPVIKGQTVLNGKITNADSNFQTLLYQTKDGAVDTSGLLLGKTNSFGNLYIYVADTSSLGIGNYESYVMVNGKKSNIAKWSIVESAGKLAITPQTIIQGNDSLTAKLTNSDSNSDVNAYISLNGAEFASSGVVGRTNSLGTWTSTLTDTSSLGIGGYLSYVKVGDKQSNTIDWNVAASSEKPIRKITSSVARGQSELKSSVQDADPNSSIVFFISYNNEPYAAISTSETTGEAGNWSLLLTESDTSGFDVGNYRTYATVNGKKSNVVSWSVVEAEGSTVQETGTTYYCRTDNKFVTDLDTLEGKTTCEKAGFVWTGTLCCSEADDPNEYYNDPEGIGGCWNKAFIKGAYGFVNGTNNSVYNSNGIFYGCALDKTNYNTNNDNLLDIKDSHTGEQLITNLDYCESDKNYFCSYTEKFLPTRGINRTRLSLLPIETSLQKGECCPEKKCWDGLKCLDSQNDKPFDTLANVTNATTAFRCIDGQWSESKKKCTPDNNLCAFCPKPSQCLLDPFAKTEGKQCIDSGKFEGDNYCNNGEWDTRTNILVSTMLDFKDKDFSLFCDSKENALNYLQYKTSSNEQASSILSRLKANNVCVLKNSNDVIIGMTLNQNSSNISTKDWSVFKLKNCDAAISLADGNYHSCDSSDKVWFNKNLISIIYSGNSITVKESAVDPLKSYKTMVEDTVKEIIQNIQDLIEEPPVDDSYLKGFPKLDRILLEVEQNREIMGAIDGAQFKNMIVKYKNFDTDICKSIDDFNEINDMNSSGIVCAKDGEDYYLLSQGGSLLNFNSDRIWQDLTAKLRIK